MKGPEYPRRRGYKVGQHRVLSSGIFSLSCVLSDREDANISEPFGEGFVFLGADSEW